MCTNHSQPAWVLPAAAIAAAAGYLLAVVSTPLAVAAASLAIGGVFADMRNTVGRG